MSGWACFSAGRNSAIRHRRHRPCRRRSRQDRCRSSFLLSLPDDRHRRGRGRIFPLIDLDEIEGRGIDCPFDAEGLSEAFAKSRFPCPEVAIGKDRLAAVERKGESLGYSPRLLDGGCHKLTLHL